MNKIITKIIAVVVCVMLVSCTNTGNVDTDTETEIKTEAETVHTDITTVTTTETTASDTETEKASIFDYIDERYVNKLCIVTYVGNTFPEILENAEEGEVFKVEIDLINTVDLAAAEAYASSCGLAQISDEYRRLKREYVKNYNRARENALVDKYGIELADESALGMYAPYISKVYLPVEKILKIVQDPEVATITYHDESCVTAPRFRKEG